MRTPESAGHKHLIGFRAGECVFSFGNCIDSEVKIPLLVLRVKNSIRELLSRRGSAERITERETIKAG